MPYSKPVIDQEGASAEAVTVELAQLAHISHPAHDQPEARVEPGDKTKFKVILPEYKLGGSDSASLLLSEMSSHAKMRDYINGLDEDEKADYEGYDTFSEKFLTSLGATIAFNWYSGQGDLSPTNVSVYEDQCYPFDFDCCFQTIQSPTSFAKSREQQFVSIDLDTLQGDMQIIEGALTNLSVSATHLSDEGFTGAQLADTLNPLFKPDTLQAIRQGFQSKLEDLSRIQPEKVVDIVNKQVVGTAHKDAYMVYMSQKNAEVNRMMVEYSHGAHVMPEIDHLAADDLSETTTNASEDDELFAIPEDSPKQLAKKSVADYKGDLFDLRNPQIPVEEIVEKLPEAARVRPISGKVN